MGLFERALGWLKGKEKQAPAARPGRNEPCWCGSGKKYKKCHQPGDEVKAAKSSCDINCGPT